MHRRTLLRLLPASALLAVSLLTGSITAQAGSVLTHDLEPETSLQAAAQGQGSIEVVEEGADQSSSISQVAGGQASDASGALAAEAPRNGIPMVTVFVDESDQTIAAAQADDPDNSYGTLQQLLDSVDHSVRGVGDVSITVPEGYVSEYGSPAAPAGAQKLEFIRGRGNTTWSRGSAESPSKRPFKLKFEDKQDLFGMGASKEWALLANVGDRTLLKNRITSWLSDQIGLSYAPQMVPVDLVMIRVKDGQEIERKSLGSYCLSEQVDVEPDGVAIDKLKKNDCADEDITGGYLISLYDFAQDADEPTSNMANLGNKQCFFQSPEFESEDLTEGQAKQRAYITDYLAQVNDLVTGWQYDGDAFIDDAGHEAIADMMDLRSAADYWWIQAFSVNPDAYDTSSTYLYKPRGGKLCWGPVWDFDQGWCASVGTHSVMGHLGNPAPWLDVLRQNDPQFIRLLKERWSDPVDGVEAKLVELTRPGGMLDAYRDEIRASWEEDLSINEKDEQFRSGGAGTLDQQIEALREWIVQRCAWIDESIDSIGGSFASVSYVVDGHEYKREVVNAAAPSLNWPDPHEYAGHEFEGWCLQGSDEIVVKPSEVRGDAFVAQTHATSCCDMVDGWCLQGTYEIVVKPSLTEDTVFVAKFKDTDIDAGPSIFPNEVFFMNGNGIEVAGGGRVAYRSSVLLPDWSGCDWSNSHMTFVVRPDDADTKEAGKTVDVPFGKAAKGTADGGRTLLDFELPLSSIEMGQRVESTFHYTRDGKEESATFAETLDEQAFFFAQWGGSGSQAAYARALHDFGRTAYGFFAAHGNGNVTADKYSPMRNCLTDAFDHGAAKAGLKESLERIGTGKDLGTSQVKKVGMTLRFDSEVTAEFNVYTKRPVDGFAAHATCKGKTFKATKVSGTQWRIRVTGLRAQDLAEPIELTGDAGGRFSMRCSALSYAAAVMDKSAYGQEGDDFMSALYSYHRAAKEIAG